MIDFLLAIAILVLFAVAVGSAWRNGYDRGWKDAYERELPY